MQNLSLASLFHSVKMQLFDSPAEHAINSSGMNMSK